MPAAAPTPAICDEQIAVLERRFLEARRAGLSHTDARRFAEGACDVGVLRRLVADGCPVVLLARIVI